MSDLIWTEDFRPRKVSESILPTRIKSFFDEMVENKNIQNYAAVGSPGSGKTSSAKALCEELGIDYLLINMSLESGIDTVRNKIISYASTISFNSDYKDIILDEFDYANKNSAQPALRGIIDEFKSNCRFIITANYENRIIDPLFSRCPPIDFNFNSTEKVEMLKQFIRRAEDILKINNIVYDRVEMVNFCKKMFPDFRRTINLLQMNSTDGELRFSSLGAASSEKIAILIDHMKKSDFGECRAWVAENAQSNDGHLIRRALYDRMMTFVDKKSIPDFVLLVNEYDVNESQVVDKEINMVAFILSIILNIEFS